MTIPKILADAIEDRERELGNRKPIRGNTEEAYKVCTRCKRRKLKRHFSPNKKASDGLQSHCLACHAAYARARRRMK